MRNFDSIDARARALAHTPWEFQFSHTFGSHRQSGVVGTGCVDIHCDYLSHLTWGRKFHEYSMNQTVSPNVANTCCLPLRFQAYFTSTNWHTHTHRIASQRTAPKWQWQGQQSTTKWTVESTDWSPFTLSSRMRTLCLSWSASKIELKVQLDWLPAILWWLFHFSFHWNNSRGSGDAAIYKIITHI